MSTPDERALGAGEDEGREVEDSGAVTPGDVGELGGGEGVLELRGRLQDQGVELEQARRMIERLERRERINELLVGSDAVDLEVARLLTEAAVEGMDRPDVREAVEDLKRHKPFLFRRRDARAGAMPAYEGGAGEGSAEAAAERASESGDRRDLLRYLRLRRKSTRGR